MSSELKIDKGIPLPPRKSGCQKVSQYAAMEVGDSAFVAGGSKGGAAQVWGRSQEPIRKFTSRQVTEDGVRGVRVWRIA